MDAFWTLSGFGVMCFLIFAGIALIGYVITKM